MSDKRKAGFYWVDVTFISGNTIREVCEWDSGNWLIAGIEAFSAGFSISNINEEMIKEG